MPSLVGFCERSTIQQIGGNLKKQINTSPYVGKYHLVQLVIVVPVLDAVKLQERNFLYLGFSED